MFQDTYTDIINIDELCEMLSIGKNTAYRLLRDKEIAAFIVGRKWKIPREAVADYVLKKSQL